MEKIDYIFMQSVSSAFKIKPRIVELGSRIIKNQGEMSARSIFGNNYTPNEYVGVDYIEGEGVDLVEDVTNLPFNDNSINTVIALNLFEHVEKVWLAMEEVKRVLSNEGTVIFGTPFSYEIHACPEDYYRYTPFFYNKMFEDLPVRITATIGYKMRPKIVYFIGSYNKDVLENYQAFFDIFNAGHLSSLQPLSKFKSNIRQYFAPNHFKKDIRHQNDLNIELETN
jgi:SAM-dependent methyltransferase